MTIIGVLIVLIILAMVLIKPAKPFVEHTQNTDYDDFVLHKMGGEDDFKKGTYIVRHHKTYESCVNDAIRNDASAIAWSPVYGGFCKIFNNTNSLNLTLRQASKADHHYGFHQYRKKILV